MEQNKNIVGKEDYCTCPDFGYYEIVPGKPICKRCNRSKPPGYEPCEIYQPLSPQPSVGVTPEHILGKYVSNDDLSNEPAIIKTMTEYSQLISASKDREAYELRLALYDMTRIMETKELTMKEEQRLGAARHILKKYFNPLEVLR